jgi:hypothetical protein
MIYQIWKIICHIVIKEKRVIIVILKIRIFIHEKYLRYIGMENMEINICVRDVCMIKILEKR